MDSLDKNKTVITAEQLANYVVCPEAWRLKYVARRKKLSSQRSKEGKEFRQAWLSTQDLSATLRHYAKIVYLLVLAIVIVVFLLEYKRTRSDTTHEDMWPSLADD